ncbi:hypothetical protein MesoLj131c_62610 [Mesorhizobium sp. 131-3-5]|uniref:hypothetical protein n=1 Tax=Mesorhizobium sp. 131-3-5 TaxID=2744520 RepID=UPI001928966B|nr:hypothetical protein [Mesorhizobium sp. 131-3-5]BCH12003.1 hypothetical protein MesoLj131c_62610 [Mesorhizobium sp. 131-3-5]
MSWVRLAIIILWLPVSLFAFFGTLQRELRSALWFAWNAMRIEHDAMRHTWRVNRFNPEDWQ